MPGVVLHVVGENFDPRPVLPELSLQPYQEFRRGEECFPGSRRGKRHQTGGFKCDVCETNGVIAEMVDDTIAFLRRHRDDLARLGRLPEVESMTLDFGNTLRIDGERVVVQSDYLPPELLKLAGELGVGIEITLYPTTDDPV